ncbi:MAG: VOC family protein [Planctomycetota bacterium]
MTNPPAGCQRVIPYLAYRDAPAAIAFLCRAFGFEERFRIPMPDGRVGHAELGLGDNVLMLASCYEEFGMGSPQDLPAVNAQILCYVDDVDAHFERARAEGAIVIAEPEDQFYGDRSYRAMDLEGHRWSFATHVRDVSLEEMGAVIPKD